MNGRTGIFSVANNYFAEDVSCTFGSRMRAVARVQELAEEELLRTHASDVYTPKPVCEPVPVVTAAWRWLRKLVRA